MSKFNFTREGWGVICPINKSISVFYRWKLRGIYKYPNTGFLVAADKIIQRILAGKRLVG
jgi:hypothetical protein